MFATGEFFYDKAGNEYELVHTDDGSFMYDGFDSFIEVYESDYSDSYFDRSDVRVFFTKDKPE